MGAWGDELAAVGRALGPRVGLPVADAIGRVTDRAAGPTTLVVTGPVSSGKSTLVNALVGRRVAPTGAGECTRLVARYVRGPVDRLDVVLTDGSRRPLPLADGGRVPAAVGDRLGLHPDDVDHLLVTLTSGALDGLTVVDTPGTGSARRPAPTGGDDADADAALVVLPAGAHARELADLAPAARRGPAGVVTVLGRADTVDAPDTTAAALGLRLGRHLGAVTPVVGLLAETAVTGALRTEDVHALGRLARLDPDVLEAALLDVGPSPLDPVDLDRLLALLDRHGVGVAVRVLRARPDAGVGEVCTALLAASGLDRLVARLADEVRARRDLLAAAAALRRLDAVVADPATPPDDAERVRDAVQDLLAHPAAVELELLEARARTRSGALALPAALTEELDHLTDPIAPWAEPGEAARRAAHWRSVASWGSPPERAEVAHAVHRAHLLRWRASTG